jgi:ubiquinone/menaquinone biosynthesis C-methylase UbiE
MPMPTRTQPRPVRHPIFARCYARVGHLMDAEIGDHRRRLLAGLTGRVLEVGAGNGLNFPHYPATVTEVLAIEPEPYLRRLALAAARQAPVPIRIVAGTAEALPAPDAAVDVVVASLVLCTVTDPDQALAEVRRVLRPGGRLRFYEHVRAEDPRLARWQDRLQRPWEWLVGGCHPNRDTVAAITAAGLRLVQLDRFDLPADARPRHHPGPAGRGVRGPRAASAGAGADRRLRRADLHHG